MCSCDQYQFAEIRVDKTQTEHTFGTALGMNGSFDQNRDYPYKAWKLDADPANNNGGVVFRDLHGAYKSVATAVTLAVAIYVLTMLRPRPWGTVNI